ncbi:MAG: hypothetical protein IJ074_06280 [Clostridia bacterium]|nr:hypothetical protein [Clostridia bacterium]
MALLMVHLLAAQRWAHRHTEYLNNPDFYLGVISPDAIHVRDHDDKSHKDEIHLYNWRQVRPEYVQAYWQAHSAPFDIGYGIHVLTDGQWVAAYRERFPQPFLPDGKVDTHVYYHDTFLSDFALYDDDGKENGLFALVAQGRAPSDHPLLREYELVEWQHMMLNAYREGCRETGVPEYIDKAFCLEFLDRCQSTLDEVYAQTFKSEKQTELL